MRPFLDKVLAGRDVKIGVIGGSISACVDSEPEDCYLTLLEKQLAVSFGAHGSKVRVYNGAVAAVGSDYFKACWAVGLPHEMDLIIIELAVNDEKSGKENEDMNQLVRSVFERDYKPSILFFNMYSPLHRFANGAPSIDTIAQYYDIPVVSHRNVVFQQRHRHESMEEIEKWFSLGGLRNFEMGHHPSKLGHELSADLLTSWFNEQLCKAPFVKSLENFPGRMELDLPADPSPWSPYSDFGRAPSPRRPDSICFGSQPGPLHFPISSDPTTFVPANWKAKHFLVGYHVGDRISFDVDVRNGVVGIMYWRSLTIGLGRARAWLDGEEDRFVWLWGDWLEAANSPVRHDIFTDRPPGHRKFIVEIDESTRDPEENHHEFRISAIIV